MLRAAVEREFEIIGEAMTQLAKVDETVADRISHHERIIAFRNVLIHQYGDVDDRLDLPRRYRNQLEALLCEHLPGVEVWAYGSRVNGRSHDGSDLDLVLRGPGLHEIPVGQVADFEEPCGIHRFPSWWRRATGRGCRSGFTGRLSGGTWCWRGETEDWKVSSCVAPCLKIGNIRPLGPLANVAVATSRPDRSGASFMLQTTYPSVFHPSCHKTSVTIGSTWMGSLASVRKTPIA